MQFRLEGIWWLGAPFMPLKEETEIENGFAQYLLGTKHEGDEASANSSISVKKRMN